MQQNAALASLHMYVHQSCIASTDGRMDDALHIRDTVTALTDV